MAPNGPRAPMACLGLYLLFSAFGLGAAGVIAAGLFALAFMAAGDRLFMALLPLTALAAAVVVKLGMARFAGVWTASRSWLWLGLAFVPTFLLLHGVAALGGPLAQDDVAMASFPALFVQGLIALGLGLRGWAR